MSIDYQDPEEKRAWDRVMNNVAARRARMRPPITYTVMWPAIAPLGNWLQWLGVAGLLWWLLLGCARPNAPVGEPPPPNEVEAVLDFAAIPPKTSHVLAVVFHGVSDYDIIEVEPLFKLPPGVSVSGYVLANDTVAVRMSNFSSDFVDLPVQRYAVRKIGMSITYTEELK